MRAWVRGVVTALVVAVALALPAMVVVWQGVQLHSQSCHALNQYRHEDKAKWDYLFHLAPPPKQGSENRVRYDDFKRFVARSDLVKQC